MKPFSVTTVDRANGSRTFTVYVMSYEEAFHEAYQQMLANAYVTGGYTSLTVTAL